MTNHGTNVTGTVTPGRPLPEAQSWEGCLERGQFGQVNTQPQAMPPRPPSLEVLGQVIHSPLLGPLPRGLPRVTAGHAGGPGTLGAGPGLGLAHGPLGSSRLLRPWSRVSSTSVNDLNLLLGLLVVTRLPLRLAADVDGDVRLQLPEHRSAASASITLRGEVGNVRALA